MVVVQVRPVAVVVIGFDQDEVGERFDGHQAGLDAVEVLGQAGGDGLGRRGGAKALPSLDGVQT
jgi:hypothetical protein